MLLRSSSRHAPLWLEALTACQRRTHVTAVTSSSSSVQESASLPCPHWVITWSAFFFDLKLDASSSHQSFDLIPASLLRSMGQHWVDQTLHTGVMSRLADVYPPALRSPGSRAACSASFTDIRFTGRGVAAFEALLATWSVHMLLAILQEKSDSNTLCRSSEKRQSVARSDLVPNVLAEGLRAEVLPVVSYLTKHSNISPSESCFSSFHVVQRALVLLLSSFWFEWQYGTLEEKARSANAFERADNTRCISVPEAAIARALFQCIDALQAVLLLRDSLGVNVNSRSAFVAKAALPPPSPSNQLTGFDFSLNSTVRRKAGFSCSEVSSKWPDVQALREETSKLFKQLLAAKASMKCMSNDRESDFPEANVLTGACRTWIKETKGQMTSFFAHKRSTVNAAEEKQLLTPDTSLFTGVTGAPAATEESDEALARINDALNQVALSSSAQV